MLEVLLLLLLLLLLDDHLANERFIAFRGDAGWEELRRMGQYPCFRSY